MKSKLIYTSTHKSSVSDPGFFPGSESGSGLTFFSEFGSGSGSAKNPDPIRKKSGSGSVKKCPRTRVKVEKMLHFISSTRNTVFFGQGPPKPSFTP